ncbi:hypothetical protein MPDQ_002510 [Monascus purpureus]|uniref:Tetratricopeptide SHNi-TPR domain-containing protein n=1 Tax=Monascus purpureus TaxID=5098 RepID=A0A507R400_MONPU|nr:hypothetical protein MPDQ_002510 [Monascus purpureus]BDD63801.1 hypothetical protein MAP00_008661 [Monascus purpureus]
MTEADKTETRITPEDSRARLADLTKRAAAKDAIKDFEAAAELYSQATELQAELNGELSVDNADLLFAYGKSLYNVAVSKSDVLGSKVAGEPQTLSNSTAGGNIASAGSSTLGDDLIKTAVANGSSETSVSEGKKLHDAAKNQPYFQFAGDENFDDSDSEDEGAEQVDGDEDEDDFANAFEVLDMARILYTKKLGAAEESQDKGKATDLPSDIQHMKERLADTYDLQAEISLEAERFTDAVTDLKVALEMKQSLYPIEDPSVAECHYKLSLALEFASVNKQKDNDDHEQADGADEGMRKEAVHHMETAIESCKIRMTQEQKKLDSDDITDEDKIFAAKRKIANVKDIIADMEQRLIDLRGPPASIKQQDQENGFLKGIIGQISGQSPAEQKARLDAATKDATDLSALVRRKPAVKQSSLQQPATKRSAEVAHDGDRKRARGEDSAPNM